MENIRGKDFKQGGLNNPPRTFPVPNNGTATKGTNDDRIISEIVKSGLNRPILVTNDRIMQIKAKMHDVTSEYYRDSYPFKSESQTYTGFLDKEDKPVCNSFRWVSGTPVFKGANEEKPIDYQHKIWGVVPRNVYQNLALELFLNPDIFLTSVQSETGYGKTYLALASALHLALEIKSNPYKKSIS